MLTRTCIQPTSRRARIPVGMVVTPTQDLASNILSHALGARIIEAGDICVDPEHLKTKEWREIPDFPEFQSQLTYVATYEAHLINEWGQDFCVDFKSIGPFIRGHLSPSISVIALSATLAPGKDTTAMIRRTNEHPNVQFSITVYPDMSFLIFSLPAQWQQNHQFPFTVTRGSGVCNLILPTRSAVHCSRQNDAGKDEPETERLHPSDFCTDFRTNQLHKLKLTREERIQADARIFGTSYSHVSVIIGTESSLYKLLAVRQNFLWIVSILKNFVPIHDKITGPAANGSCAELCMVIGIVRIILCDDRPKGIQNMGSGGIDWERKGIGIPGLYMPAPGGKGITAMTGTLASAGSIQVPFAVPAHLEKDLMQKKLIPDSPGPENRQFRFWSFRIAVPPPEEELRFSIDSVTSILGRFSTGNRIRIVPESKPESSENRSL
ncbi:hypothetical protein C8R45DRAFT_927775 [Mycena sanguinolenta]|nr:hypothetical protein C8R45DRAFT_927775 [Mycena sanguinolenta]